MWAAIPIKPVGQAKSRLSRHLHGATLSRLFIAMLKDVLGALRACAEVERLLLVSSVARAGDLATEFGAELLEDDGSGGLNGACDLAARHVAAAGGDRLLILHGDLPLITPRDITAITAAHSQARAAGTPALTLIPNLDGTGTNGMLAEPPHSIDFQFGANSLHRHRDAAKAAGARPQLAQIVNLALDVDAPQDLKLLYAHRAYDCHTTRLLNELGWPATDAAQD